MSMRRLGAPRPVSVQTDAGGLPTSVGRTAVEAVNEDWIVEDRWWTGQPLRRRYFEVVLSNGANAVVYRDLEGGAGLRSGRRDSAQAESLEGGRWFTQRA